MSKSPFSLANLRQMEHLHHGWDRLHAAIYNGCLCCLLAIGCDSKAPKAESTIAPRVAKTEAQRLSLVEFSPDGRSLAVGGALGEVVVWTNLHEAAWPLTTERSQPLLTLRWSPDRLLVATNLAGKIVGWQFNDSTPQQMEFPELPVPAVCLAFRPHSKSPEMVLGLRDGSLLFLSDRGPKQLKPDHRGSVKQAAYSSDGRRLLTAGADGQLIWRDASTRKVVQAVAAHDSEISQLVVTADGTKAATGDWNGRISVWDTATRKSLKSFSQPDAVSGAGWWHDVLITGSWDGRLRLWNVASGNIVRTINAGLPIQHLSVDARLGRVATVHLDGMVRLWDIPSGAK